MSTAYAGYTGRVMLVNLSDETVQDYPWSDAERKQYLGGKPMAYKLLYDHLTGKEHAFSEENWNRPQEEVQGLMALMVKAMAAEMDKLHANGVRFMVVGNRERLGAELNATIDACMERTAANEVLTLVIFLSYSGKWDILQAAKKMAAQMLESPEKADEVMKMDISGFDAYLATAGIPDPDLIVRTSGEYRLSNYLLWQGAYSELLFTDTLWPDFRKEDFRKALDYYSKRDRRYGKVK